MARNGKVYLSAPPGADPVVATVLRALKEKRADVWRGPAAMGALTPEALRELAECDALIRLLNSRTDAAETMRLELAEFQRLRALDAQMGNTGRRVILNLITESDACERPDDAADRTINTIREPEGGWLPGVLTEIGQPRSSAWFLDGRGPRAVVAGSVIALALLVALTVVLSRAALPVIRALLSLPVFPFH